MTPIDWQMLSVILWDDNDEPQDEAPVDRRVSDADRRRIERWFPSDRRGK